MSPDAVKCQSVPVSVNLGGPHCRAPVSRCRAMLTHAKTIDHTWITHQASRIIGSPPLGAVTPCSAGVAPGRPSDVDRTSITPDVRTVACRRIATQARSVNAAKSSAMRSSANDSALDHVQMRAQSGSFRKLLPTSSPIEAQSPSQSRSDLADRDQILIEGSRYHNRMRSRQAAAAGGGIVAIAALVVSVLALGRDTLDFTVGGGSKATTTPITTYQPSAAPSITNGREHKAPDSANGSSPPHVVSTPSRRSPTTPPPEVTRGTDSQPGVAYLDQLPLTEGQIVESGAVRFGTANYPRSVQDYCYKASSGADTWNVAGYRRFKVTFGIDNNAYRGSGSMVEYFVTDQDGRNISAPVKVFLGKPKEASIDLSGVVQMKVACSGVNITTDEQLSLLGAMGDARLER